MNWCTSQVRISSPLGESFVFHQLSHNSLLKTQTCHFVLIRNYVPLAIQGITGDYSTISSVSLLLNQNTIHLIFRCMAFIPSGPNSLSCSINKSEKNDTRIIQLISQTIIHSLNRTKQIISNPSAYLLQLLL